MRYIVPANLLMVALIHALPLIGVVSATRLTSLYGIAVEEPNLEILLRHRAVLFGMLAAFLAFAAFRPALHGLALVAGFVSVISFLVIVALIGDYNASVARVVRADLVALAALIVGGSVHGFMTRRAIPSRS